MKPWASYLGGCLAATLLIAAGAVRAQENEPAPLPGQEQAPEDKRAPGEGEAPEQATPPETAEPGKSPETGNILEMDIEQLGKVPAKVPTAFETEVTSVTAHKSSVGKSAAAVFVITNEMIRRSGVTSIPEALRLAPGLQVAKIGSDKWAITSRGFNSEFAQKLLVLFDGRTVYTSFDAGVYWEVQDYVLQDIDRIEVIRGPGATIWGANAVNGVINIITKKSDDTQGRLVSAGGGNQDRTINSVRTGGQLGEHTHYRAYVRAFDRAPGFNPQGVHDGWNQIRGGFRVDSENPEKNDTYTLQGDIYAGMIGETSPVPQTAFPFFGNVSEKNHVGGGNILGRWSRVVDENNSWALQAYYDRMERLDVDFNIVVNTYDTEFRQFLKHADTHMFTWGAGYRLIVDNLQGSRPLVSFSPQAQTWDQASLFGQEEMPLFRDDLKFTVGAKLLYYYFTGFEYQPTARLLWEVDEKRRLGGRIARRPDAVARRGEHQHRHGVSAGAGLALDRRWRALADVGATAFLRAGIPQAAHREVFL